MTLLSKNLDNKTEFSKFYYSKYLKILKLTHFLKKIYTFGMQLALKNTILKVLRTNHAYWLYRYHS